jgi:uncharacterized RDD family membrane protein YckC
VSLDRHPPIAPGEPAGLVRRFLANVVDGAFLIVACELLSLLWPRAFAWLKPRLGFVGPVVILLYMGLLQSKIGGGQTLGDRLLRLRVVSLERLPLTFSRAFTRALVGLFMTACAGLMIIVVALEHRGFASRVGVVTWMFSLAVIGGCFLSIPFHPLGRGLHDILTGSLVVGGNVPDPGFIAAHDDSRRDRRIVVAAGFGVALAAMLAVVPL